MKRRDILVILIPIFILTVLWVMFTIYHNLTTSTIKDPLTIQIIPINGAFDLKTIEALKKRQNVEPDYESNPSGGLSPTPSPEPEVSVTPEEASSSGIQSPDLIQEAP